jgi:hypothetical protein
VAYNLERFSKEKMILTENPVRQDLVIESKRVAAIGILI